LKRLLCVGQRWKGHVDRLVARGSVELYTYWQTVRGLPRRCWKLYFDAGAVIWFRLYNL